MEADWEVEIGPDAPIIDAQWAGFVDLRQTPELARLLPETASLPGLDRTLVRLNQKSSPVWTAKCDVWALDMGEFDADELDASVECAAYAWGCYVDLLSANDQSWVNPAHAVALCRRVCALLHTVQLACCRVDLIVRQAAIASDRMEIGVTVYLTACGATSAGARQALRATLDQFANSIHAFEAAETIE